MSNATGPYPLVVGQPLKLTPPAGAPLLQRAVQLDNQSPWLLQVSTGQLDTWLAPWVSNVYPVSGSATSVVITPQQIPGAPRTGGVSTSLTATWLDADERPAGVFPALLNTQLALVGGKQDLLWDETSFLPAGFPVVLPLSLAPVDRSLLVLITVVDVEDVANNPTFARLTFTATGGTTGVVFGQQVTTIADPSIPATDPPAPLVFPAYGGNDPTMNLGFVMSNVPSVAAVDHATIRLAVLSMPDPLLPGGTPAQPQWVAQADASDRVMRLDLPVGGGTGVLIPADTLQRGRLRVLTASTAAAPAAADRLTLSDAFGVFLSVNLDRFAGLDLNHRPEFAPLSIAINATTTAGSPATKVTLLVTETGY